MRNTISLRIADFLKSYPPFHLLEQEELKSIAEEITVQYNYKGEHLFKQEDPCKPYFYLIQQGAVEIYQNENGKEITLDQCDEGDLFGLRPLFAGKHYSISAKTLEESIFYLIPIQAFKPITVNNPKVSEYLLSSLASNTHTPYYTESPSRGNLDLTSDIHELQTVHYNKKLISCSKDTTIKDLAGLMNLHSVGSVVILEDGKPTGIVTDKDIRVKVASGNWDIQMPVKEIMNSPVICYPASLTASQAHLAMMKHRISHICITEDGTPNSNALGIVAEHDLIVSQGNNPYFLMKALLRAKKTKDLKKIRRNITALLEQYIKSNIPMTHISRVMFELNDATIKKCIALSIKKMNTPPPCKFAWMSLGSQGRKEQLLLTDQDNAIVFEDQDEASYPDIHTYFMELAKNVNKRLLKIGFDYCPADMMAGNPKWCLSLSQWKEQFSDWVKSPIDDHILLCQVFFDYDISYGELNLVNALADHIFKVTSDLPIFKANLARSALLNPSPMGFFRQFLLETNGEYKDFFDLKKRALIPITDAARVLILEHQVKNINNTFERYEKLAELEPQNRELYLSASYATKVLLKFRTRQGLMHGDSGRFIDLKSLSKEEKVKLKRCFNTIGDLQDLIKLRYKLVNLI
ncbi:DUF294 nucleotidyltransferase-like domain-containing protein [Robertkochia flava]|uniref:DUF294 nucleotidyltransferase-like domain-containing protein n=1 Tax=Robertkochia flava TaxID=3447986 RepID=UPI001CCDDC67|nr:DUF294 nucleotidyltransferase-like domain-containing protein [Robertkochia marina]